MQAGEQKDQLLRRADATIAAAVICAALHHRYVDLDPAVNEKHQNRLMSSHVMSCLTGVSHGRIQATIKLLQPLDTVL